MCSGSLLSVHSENIYLVHTSNPSKHLLIIGETKLGTGRKTWKLEFWILLFSKTCSHVVYALVFSVSLLLWKGMTFLFKFCDFNLLNGLTYVSAHPNLRLLSENNVCIKHQALSTSAFTETLSSEIMHL